MTPYPKKQFGQHFLRDTGILRRLEQQIRPAPTDCILEIGAGDGALSHRIAPLVGRFVALEVDADLMPALEARLAACSNAQAVRADILELDLAAFLGDAGIDPAQTRLLGNLPYYIASEIIRRFLRLPVPVRDMTFMVQLEVAQRIISPPGSRVYGYLSVDCQHRAEIRMLFKVHPACFSPPPKVTSAVIELRPRKLETGTETDAAFDQLVKAAFAHRRKTLLNSLKQHPQIGPVAGHLLETAGVAEGRRAEELSVKEFEDLAVTYCSIRACK